MNEQGMNIVMDRCHLTEYVYGTYSSNRKVLVDPLWRIDGLLAELDPILVYVYPEDLEKSNEESGINLTSHALLFRQLLQSTSIQQKIYVSYSTIDKGVEAIATQAFKYDLYFASPFFNPSQVEREEALKAILRSNGLRIFSPKEEILLEPNASAEDRRRTFEGNCAAIRDSIAVFAVTDEKDMGTIWEAGYAYGIKKPIIYFAETLGDNCFNVMLAQSGKKVFLDRAELTQESILAAIFDDPEIYEGMIV